MVPPRYRTLDGDELDLPLAMDRWVLVPLSLARFDPELAWTLDYEDAPEPEDADPRLDFTAGALLVPVERWNERAALEPNLAPCRPPMPLVSDPGPPAATPQAASPPLLADELDRVVDVPDRVAFAATAARVISRAIRFALGALAVAYVGAVAAWLWSLRQRITGPDVSSGVLLVGAAMLLAWLAGVAGAVPGVRSLRSTRWPDPADRRPGAGQQFLEQPLAILRAGLVLQLAGFVALTRSTEPLT